MRYRQIGIAAATCICLMVFAVVVQHPLALVVGGLLPLIIIFTLRAPLPLVLAFTIFSFFRIHEVFTVLFPLHIPQLLALGALASLIWGIWCHTVTVYWSRELKAFSLFFFVVTIGLFFATNRPEAWAAWSGTYVKIAVMTVALAWLVSSINAFRYATHTFVWSGIVVGTVALYNKVNAIGLVEGSRVTIGRDIGSMLGDPNDLALVMLFPASFALASMLSKQNSKIIRLIAAIGFAIAFAAIIATQSRGGLLGITAVMGVFAWRRIQNKSLLVAFSSIALLMLFALAGVDERASGGADEAGIDESAMGRIYAWGAAWQMALSHPLTGVGLKNFISNYWTYSAHWDGTNHAVHSTWFGVLAETGFLGLIVFIGMTVVTVRSAVQSVTQLSNAKGPALVMAQAVEAGLVGFLICGTFLTMGFTWPFYILLALTSAVSQYVRRASFSASQTEK
ncbi:MAG: oligosaccharide repeat unit polymerase [Rhodospirillaceae bacterium]|nr:MAG: oligosaccharide repeat unit polymerase [Rhodospirillaceae bacterium]